MTISTENFKGIIPIRKPDSHKGDYGHVFILAGSLGLTGAAYLTSQAALLAGSGLVTLGIPKSLNPIMAVKLTEVMTKPLPETKELSFGRAALQPIKKMLADFDALAIGPGLSRNAQTQELVAELLTCLEQPAVLDADGLNALIGRLTILKRLKTDLVITPHPGEMARLLNLKVSEVQKERGAIAVDFARKYQVVVVLKGYHSVVADADGEVYINQTGNPGMASAGCGDVLTGIIASFLGQGIKAFPAAKLAVYLHGLAGDLAAKKKGEISVIATDILAKLARALQTVI